MNDPQALADTAYARQRLRTLLQQQAQGADRPQLKEVAAYLGAGYKWLRAHALESTPKACPRACPTIDSCRLTCRTLHPGLRKRILKFFELWDAGRIRRVQMNGIWQLVLTDPPNGGPAPPSVIRSLGAGRSHRCKIDWGKVKLKLAKNGHD